MKRIILLIIGCWITLCLYAGREKVFYFSALNLKDGLSQMSVLKICQDAKGFMWFATRNGLNKYDGEKFTVYWHNNQDSLSLTDNHITSLLEDSKGNLWVGTVNGLNRMDLKTGRIYPYHKTSSSLSLASDNVLSLYEDDKKRLWVGTNNGISLYIPEYDAFQHIELNGLLSREGVNVVTQDSRKRFLIGTSSKGLIVCNEDMKYIRSFTKATPEASLTDNKVSAIYEDSRGQLWVGTNKHGLNRVDIDRSQVVNYTRDNSRLPNNNIRCFCERDGKLLIGTFAGLCLLDIGNYKFTPYKNYNLKEGSLSHFSVYSIYIDRSGTLWVGTYAGGVNYYNAFNNRFVFHDPVLETNSLFGIFGTMVSTPDNWLWIATEGGGLLGYDVKNKKFRHYLLEKNTEVINHRNIIKSLMLEGDKLWCGTNNGHIYQFDIHSRTFRSYYHFPEEYGIYVIDRDSLGNLWVGTTGKTGLFCFSPDGKRKSTFHLSDSTAVSFNSIRSFWELRKGVYLVGTRSDGLIKLDLQKNTSERYNTGREGHSGLGNDYVSFIMRDTKGRLWIGTFGGGLHQYDEKLGIVQRITTEQGLADDNICSVVESCDHRLWISTSNGISEYDPENGKINNYNSSSEIQVREFTPNGVAKLSDGELYFSGNNGILSFYPGRLVKNTYLPPVVLKELVVNNQAIRPGDNTGILRFSLDDTPVVELQYNQNNLSIGYGALNYVFPEQNSFAYRLVGYDKDWIYAGNRKEAFYTNLNPGTYIFEVKAANNDGLWNQQGKSLQINIRASVWLNPWAYTIYGLIAVLVFAVITYYRHVKRKLEQDLNIKQFEKQKLEEFHQAKIRMFTDFSHELRTPLTLIINPLEEILKRVDLGSGLRESLRLANRNAQRLLLLVNQLLDLRRNQSGNMSLKVSEENLYPFVQEIFYAFKQIAGSKQVDFTFEAAKKHIDAWIDRSLFEKVIFNLLSNAFKYTGEGEKVVLKLGAPGEEEARRLAGERAKDLPSAAGYICLEVCDTGRGIPDAEIEHIFDPFYRLQRELDERQVTGTGIGLSLTYSVVSLHHGIIRAEANVPKGTCFRVIVPVDKRLYTPEQLKPAEVVLPEITEQEKHPVYERSGRKKYTLLLVEDNKEIRLYMKNYFTGYYRVLEAGNGVEAFEKVTEEIPDLVVSDIMMPKMDGLELCASIKNDLRTGHIPVILLTARAMVMQVKDGFHAGADDYIVKPFNIDLLHCRIEALLAQREKLRELYGKKFSMEAMGIEISSADDRFMQKFFEVIENNISNPELNVDILCEGVGLSRTNLYRKLKAVTDLSPMELIRNKRMEVAVKLLETTDMTISEISIHVGFNSHAYFTNNFKSIYGLTPKEYVQNRKKAEKQ